MFIHFSIILIIFKVKKTKFDQKSYDQLFDNIENNLREAGMGDVSVNKKMKDLNKILYDILLKINFKNENEFKINKKLILKYFKELENEKSPIFQEFERYFIKFYEFCFELPMNNMIREAIKFKY